MVVLAYPVALLRRHSGYSPAVDGFLYVGDAWIWRLFATGIALYAGGWAAVAQWLTHDAIQPIPSIAEVGWLGLYPMFFVAIATIMRRLRIERISVLTAIDALVAGLGASAVCAALVLPADLAGARVVLEKLRALGVRISIDDYGTGYSSLAYLRDLPVDELKLDRAFVEPILSDQRAAAIVRSTIELAHSLGLRMVGERALGSWPAGWTATA